MPNREPSAIVIAVRVYPDTKKTDDDFDPKKKRKRKWKLPGIMFVWDTETRTDKTQRLTFGSYRLVEAGLLVKENLFYGPALPAVGERKCQRAEVEEMLFRAAYKGRFLLTAFNFPFDISRVARDSTKAKGRFTGGFSLNLWSYIDGVIERGDRFRPSICIKHIDSKRALKGFTGRQKPDDEDRIPEGSTTGKPEKGYIFRGHARGIPLGYHVDLFTIR